MRKNVKLVICLSILMSLFILMSYNVFAEEVLEEQVVMYHPDGNIALVDKSDVEEYKLNGWSLTQINVQVKLYLPDGRTAYVAEDDVDSHVAAGWSTEPYVKMYDSEGTEYNIKSSEVEAYKKVGLHEKTVDVKVETNTREITCYFNTDIPDFSKVTGVPLYEFQEAKDDIVVYYYNYTEESIVEYISYLIQNGWKKGTSTEVDIYEKGNAIVAVGRSSYFTMIGIVGDQCRINIPLKKIDFKKVFTFLKNYGKFLRDGCYGINLNYNVIIMYDDNQKMLAIEGVDEAYYKITIMVDEAGIVKYWYEGKGKTAGVEMNGEFSADILTENKKTLPYYKHNSLPALEDTVNKLATATIKSTLLKTERTFLENRINCSIADFGFKTYLDSVYK